MALTFEHVSLGQRVLFGAGKAAENLVDEVAAFGAKRVMVVASGAGSRIGGGSTTGLAKAVAMTSGLPIVAVPRRTRSTRPWPPRASGH